MPYCTTCGSEVVEDMLFCPQCGRGLRAHKAKPKIDKTAAYPEQLEELPSAPRPRKRGRLYKQWVVHAGLPRDETVPAKTPRRMPLSMETMERSPAPLYLLLGIFIGVAVTALIVVLV